MLSARVIRTASSADLAEIAQGDDPHDAEAAEHRLVCDYTPLVKATAAGLPFPEHYREDLEQAGRIGVIVAARTYDRARCPSFGPLVKLCVRREVHRAYDGLLCSGAFRGYQFDCGRGRRLMVIDYPADYEEADPASEHEAFEAVVAEEERESVARHIAGLPQRDREFLDLMLTADATETSVAAELGVTQQAVSKRFARIRRKARGRLVDQLS